MNFLMICLGMLILTLLNNIQSLLSTFFQFLISYISVQINKQNLEITKLEVEMNNITNHEPSAIGFQLPKYNDEDVDDEYKGNTKDKFSIGFRGGSYEKI